MSYIYAIWITVTLCIFLNFGVYVNAADNLTCYQCIKTVNEECDISDLKSCAPEKDRCVTHITKDAKNGFSIKRECGLGPCGFDDDMMNRGLGLNGCDRSKDEYFCLFCCRQSGCNKSLAPILLPSLFLVIITLFVIFNVAILI